MHISGIDLNLLSVFDAIMRERSITRAAVQLGLTQPAVSHALGRLRRLLGDRLFVRSPQGMIPTPAAEALDADLGPALRQIGLALENRDTFNPATTTRRFQVGMSDYASIVFLPKLNAALRKAAPGAFLTVRSTSHSEGIALLENGGADVIVGNFPLPPAHMAEELLFKEDFVCAGGANLPALRRPLTIKSYLAQDHLQVSTRGESHGYVDNVLDGLGLKRNVKVTVGHFLVAPFLVENSTLLATEPRRLFTPLAKRLSLKLKPPPFAIPSFRVVQTWHERHTSDSAHVWLRKMIAGCFRS